MKRCAPTLLALGGTYANNVEGMVQAWVGHFVTPQKRTYDKYD